MANLKKPKYKRGDMVYSWKNPTTARPITKVSAGERGYPTKYRLELVIDGRKLDWWVDETSVSKRRKKN